MALKVNRQQSRFALFTLVSMLFLGAISYIASTTHTANAVVPTILPPSVLCAPNVCNSDEAKDSLQDVNITNTNVNKSGGNWVLTNGYASPNTGTKADASKRVLEIANQSNHFMKSVTIGVYVTQDLYDNMATKAIPLNFVYRDCDVGGSPTWNITLQTPDSATTSPPLASYTKATSGSFCGNVTPVGYNMSNYKPYFQKYASQGVILYYTKMTVNMTNFNPAYNKDDRSIRFQIKLTDVCGGNASCKEYVALVAPAIDTTGTCTGDQCPRNFALSGKDVVQKKVTNNRSRDSDKGTYDYIYDSKYKNGSTGYTQKAIRQYMEFGLECTIKTPSRRIINIYDINDGDLSSPETHGWVGGEDIVGIVLQYFDPASGLWRDAPNSGVNRATTTNSNTTTQISRNNASLYRLNNTDLSVPQTVYIPDSGDRITTKIALTMSPGVKYRIAITPDHPRNFIAVGLPGDQIYGLVGCNEYGPLEPNVSGSGAISAGDAAKFADSIHNDVSSSTTDATGIKWKAYGFVLPRGQAMPPIGGDTNNDYANNAVACSGLIACKDLGSNLNPGESIQLGKFFNTNTSYVDTTLLSSGDKVCSFMAISPYQMPDSPLKWRVSGATCYVVASGPTVQVWGNDIRVGSAFVNTAEDSAAKIKGLLRKDAGQTRGSWVEYGAIAPNDITNFASGSGLNRGVTTNSPTDWSKLTFANTSLAGTMGNFDSAGSLGQIPDVKTYLTSPGVAAKAGLTVLNVPGGTPIGAYVGNRVYVVNGTAVITNDIINNASNGVANLTQMIIIADKINISENVTKVDAWLIAPGGEIDTCVRVGVDQRLATTVCNKPLKVNGPLMAGTVSPRRTSGDGMNASEILDLRGDAYIWGRKVSEANGSIHTTYLRELPPRY
ncbi:MAG: hypothetical protein ABIP74_02900 [Candidatus Saccharimonas sp.]